MNAGDSVGCLQRLGRSCPGSSRTASRCQQLLEMQVEETKLQAPEQRERVTNLVPRNLPYLAHGVEVRELRQAVVIMVSP